MTNSAKFLFSHLIRLMIVPHLASEVAIGYRKREIEAADVIGSGRRGVWDVLLKACEELMRPDALEALQTFRELGRGELGPMSELAREGRRRESFMSFPFEHFDRNLGPFEDV